MRGVKLIDRVKGVIFDLEGTLIDHIEFYKMLIEGSLEGVKVDINELKKLLDGDVSIPEVIDHFISVKKDGKVIEEFKRKVRYLTPKLRSMVKLLPGAMDVPLELKKRGIRLAILTNIEGPSNMISIWYPISKPILEVMDVILTAIDVEKKPSPKGVIKCTKILGLKVNEIAVVGDSRVDIIAGRKAGAYTVGVLTGVGSYESLEAENPTAIIKDLTYFDQVYVEV